MDELHAFEQSGSIWIPKVYTATGSWAIVADDEGLRFDLGQDFSTSPGPDLKLYLSELEMDAIGERDSIDRVSVGLGLLTRPSGAQSYRLPFEDFTAYRSVAIHCQAYSVVWCGVPLAH